MEAGAEPRTDADPDAIWASIEAAGPNGGPGPVSVLSLPFDDDEARAHDARRRTFIAFYGYAVPTKEAVSAIARFAAGVPVLEVGAGSGLWANLLATTDSDIVATDAITPRSQPYAPIEVLDAEDAVRAHPECGCLLTIWPPDRQDIAFRALRSFEGERLVHVGDSRFTGDDDFRALLARDWELAERVALPSWPGLDDFVRLYAHRR
jgi:hypothetical protein